MFNKRKLSVAASIFIMAAQAQAVYAPFLTGDLSDLSEIDLSKEILINKPLSKESKGIMKLQNNHTLISQAPCDTLDLQFIDHPLWFLGCN